MKFYEAEVSIDAPASAVWEVLADGEGFVDWESGVERFEGTMALGEKVTVYSEVSPGRAFPVTVVEFAPDRRMTWRGGMPFGLFVGTRTFDLTPAGTGTRFVMREEFTGPMVPLIWRSMPDLGPTFEKFAEGLKARVEGGA